MLDLLKLIELKARSMGIKDYTVEPIQIEVNIPYMIINLDRYLYLFSSTQVDTKILPTRVDLQSPDNLCSFTRTTLEKSHVSQFQFFTEQLTIKTTNYGSDSKDEFHAFTLEFLKVIPKVN